MLKQQKFKLLKYIGVFKYIRLLIQKKMLCHFLKTIKLAFWP